MQHIYEQFFVYKIKIWPLFIEYIHKFTKVHGLFLKSQTFFGSRPYLLRLKRETILLRRERLRVHSQQWEGRTLVQVKGSRVSLLCSVHVSKLCMQYLKHVQVNISVLLVR